MMLSENEVVLPAENLHRFIRSRRSVRRFGDRPVSREVLERVLASAICAPSAHNQQPWRFAVLRSAASRRLIARSMGDDFRRALEAEGLEEDAIQSQLNRSHQRVEQAPAAILLCADLSSTHTYADAARSEGERTMAMQSAALAGGYLLLAAHAEGLGGVWVCAPLFAAESVRAALDLPLHWVAQALLLLGYPVGRPVQRSRRSVEDVTRFL